ncbi:amidohydrolase family protein [Sphaerisporangium sp. NBC_01403]|uniref:amidohydrolase family protein n=1 Tax=Sphaerisporangium sp. NBC_01403 TaxID=2903599 RepID=UPI0032506F15
MGGAVMGAHRGQRPLLLRCRALLAHARAVQVEDAGVLVEGGTVVRVAPFADLAGEVPADRTVTLDGTVLPAFTDAHSHLRALPLAEQGVADACLEIWVVRLTGTTALDPHNDALVAAADLAATGVTTVQAIHHTFAPPDEYAAGVGAVVSALEKAGLRAELALGLTDRSEFLPERAHAAWRGAERLAAPGRGVAPADFPGLFAAADLRGTRRVRLGVAPVAPQWCSDAALAALRRCAAGGLRVHTHLLESRHQRDWSAEGDPTGMLDRCGLLGSNLSAAHGVWLTGAEIGLLARRGTALVHCATSNRRLGSGDAPVRAWLDAGVNVALGLDSQHESAPDMFAEMRAALATAERAGGPLTPREVLALATEGGAAATGHGARLGRIAPGYRADLIAVASGHGRGDVVDRIVYDTARTDVADVFSGGRRLVESGVARCHAEADAARARLRATLAADRAARAARLTALAAHEEPLRGLLAGVEA